MHKNHGTEFVHHLPVLLQFFRFGDLKDLDVGLFPVGVSRDDDQDHSPETEGTNSKSKPKEEDGSQDGKIEPRMYEKEDQKKSRSSV